ncbi:MAG: hypothetical protein WDZ40_00195 [Candidatus Spechtbacterales bacterium]
MKPIIISADEIKKTLPRYNPKKSGDFHTKSAKIADIRYEEALKENENIKKVILLSGGSASGKTEYLSAYLSDENAIIVDGTLSTLEGFKVKYKKAIQKKKKVYIHSVIPDDLKRAFIAFLARERKYDEKYFFETHSNSRTALLQIVKNYKNIPITIIQSRANKKNQMEFEELSYKSRKGLIDYLEDIKYNKNEIIEIITKI